MSKSMWLLVAVVALGGFQCPPPPPVGMDCKSTDDGSKATQTLTWGADSMVQTVPRSGGKATTAISIGHQPYLSVEVPVDSAGKPRTVTARFGTAFSVRELVLTTTDGETFTGTLDGKALKPFARKSAPQAYADGSPLPAISSDADSRKELQAFLDAANHAPDACKAKSAALGRLVADAANGYQFFPYGSSLCISAWAGCMATTAGCEALVVNQCSALGEEVAVIVCGAVETMFCHGAGMVCLVGAGFIGLTPGTLCCPSACGPQRCCGIDDKCLDDNTGLCCPKGHTKPCGAVCCQDTDQCFANVGVCCRQGEKLCRDRCCAGTCNQTTGECCPSGQSCGGCGVPGADCCDGKYCQAGSGCVGGKCLACVNPPPAPQNTVVATLHRGHDLFGTDHWYTCENGFCADGLQPALDCPGGTRQYQCLGRLQNANGSVCQTQWLDDQHCGCLVHLISPDDLSKSADCDIIVSATSSPPGCDPKAVDSRNSSP